MCLSLLVEQGPATQATLAVRECPNTPKLPMPFNIASTAHAFRNVLCLFQSFQDFKCHLYTLPALISSSRQNAFPSSDLPQQVIYSFLCLPCATAILYTGSFYMYWILISLRPWVMSSLFYPPGTGLETSMPRFQ